MIWKDKDFQRFAAYQFKKQYGVPYIPSEALARNYLYRTCKLTLASELENIEENKTFKGLMKVYNQWNCSNPDIPL